MRTRVTMADIAQQAGVHVTTVSLALRNHPSLPPATRERLQLLARQIGYQPDPALRALIAYRRQALPPKERPPLAYLTHWESEWGWRDHPAHVDFHRGATSRAQTLGYRLEHFWLGAPKLSLRRMSDILVARGISGLVIGSHQPAYDQSLDFDWPKFSAVKIDFFPREPKLHNVTNDQRAISQLALQRVLAAGYRRAGFVAPRWWDEAVDLGWSAGFLAEQQRLAPEDRIPPLIYPERPSSSPGLPGTGDYLVPRDLFAAWFRRHRPEVLISYAPFVLPRLAELGLRVPRDVAYVEIFLGAADGRVAGIRQNCQRVGELAVEILAGQLQQYNFGLPPFPTTTLVEGTWCDGASLPIRRVRPAVRAGAARATA
ncbi:MAG TPA: LacI family DNA-binding transcriptional regulator [Opitutaceae bacterium]|nr:LacI family DNA-binding transcriptional regulator [Opitutaceae bacterium]